MKIKQEVLEVLERLQFDGNNAVITEQLDRKQYVAVNKILVAAGGKWVRKDKAHVFPNNAQETMDRIITEGEITTKRDVGFFNTPPALASKLVKDFAKISRPLCVLEPSAGEGNIVDAILSTGAEVDVVEWDDNRRNLLKEKGSSCVNLLKEHDFLDVPVPEEQYAYDAVVMNPPFAKVGKGDHLDHVRHAYKFLDANCGILVAVLPFSVKWRTDKRHKEFHSWYESLGGIVTDLPENSFKSSGTAVNTVVLTIERG